MIGSESCWGTPCGNLRTAALAMLVVLTALGCGDSGTNPDRVTTTTTSAPTTTTTTVSTTTTTSTATTSTTTTSAAPQLIGSFRVENTPCVAPGSGSVSCRFVATGTGGNPPYTFNWRFEANNRTATPSGQQVDPALGCEFAAGVTTFQVAITLTTRDSIGNLATTTGTQQIARASGACGT
jgi:hypothetical protein